MLQRILSEAVALLAPPSCASCREQLARGDELLCPACRRALPWLREPRCPRCGLPAPCGARCPAARAAFARSWAPHAHDGPARDLVAALKFRGALPLADLMAAQIAAGAPRELLRDVALVPVPLPAVRRRARGFDQARRLAAALGRRTGLALRPCLARAGTAQRQLGATRAARLDRGRLQIRVRAPPPLRALLVDDVHTTGATLDGCARALRAGGSREVFAVTYTRSLGA